MAMLLLLSACGINKSARNSKSNRLSLDKNEIQQIGISYSLPLFQGFDITDREQISTVVDYLISLHPFETKLNPKDYVGGGYSVKIRFKDNTERVFILMGNKFFMEKDGFTYEIPYKEATEFDVVVADILQTRQIQNGEASVEGTVISVEAAESGRSVSCVIRDKDNKTFNISLNNAKIIDATGNGWMILHENDVIRAFYLGDIPTDSGSIAASTVYIKNADGGILSTAKDEFRDVVYQGYLYKCLYENEWGWNLCELCSTLGINMVIQEDKNGIYKNWAIPINFYVEKKGIKLAFEGDMGSLDGFDIKNPYMASIRYKVYKDGKEILLKHVPLTYRSGGPYMDIKELLGLFEISYYTDADTLYIDSMAPTDVKGKIFFDGNVALDSGKKVYCKLIYTYKNNNDTGYSSVELHFNDGREQKIPLFTEDHRGSAEYYDGGGIDHISIKGEDFIQVNLSQDTFIYKYLNGQLIYVFSEREYKKYFKGNFALEGDTDGKYIYTDKLNKIRRELVCDDVKPRTAYKISVISFDRLEQDVNNNSLNLVLNAGVIEGEKQIFGFSLTFVYDGKAFIPSKVVSIDWKKFGADKQNGKDIRSMSDYRYFEYEWENKEIEKEIYGLFAGDKTSGANAKKIFDLLPYADWSRFASINTDRFFQIMDWLENRKYENTEELATVMDSTNGLDGGYTEKYCSVLKGFFLKDMKGFIKALSSLDEEQARLIASYTVYGLSYGDTSSIEKDMENLCASGGLTQKEKEAANALYLKMSSGN